MYIHRIFRNGGSEYVMHHTAETTRPSGLIAVRVLGVSRVIGERVRMMSTTQLAIPADHEVAELGGFNQFRVLSNPGQLSDTKTAETLDGFARIGVESFIGFVHDLKSRGFDIAIPTIVIADFDTVSGGPTPEEIEALQYMVHRIKLAAGNTVSSDDDDSRRTGMYL